MPDFPLTGGCNCGGVRFEVTEAPISASWCHCTRCQRRTGSSGSPQARLAPGSLHVLEGEELLREFQPPDGFRQVLLLGLRLEPMVEPGARPGHDRSPCGSASSTPTRVSARASISSSPMRPPGIRFRTTGSRATPSITARPDPHRLTCRREWAGHRLALVPRLARHFRGRRGRDVGGWNRAFEVDRRSTGASISARHSGA